MKKTCFAVVSFLVLLVFAFVGALASGDIQSAYQTARKDSGETTANLVDSIDLEEFSEYYGLELSYEDEMLIKVALMSYSTGAILQHPVGISKDMMATADDDKYVGNKSSKKFHYSWCSSVSDIKDKNKVTFNSREEAIDSGYVPCKRCNP